MEWKNLYRGFLVGASDLVPGISGGTIALLLGIYHQLIRAINGLFSKEWKKHLGFLIPLGLGMGTAIFLLAKLINWLIKYYPVPLQYFFLGLILGVLPYLFKQANVKETFRMKHYIILIAGAVLIGTLGLVDQASGQAVIEERSFDIYLYLFFTGMLASTALILPGISGSMVMLMMGAYYTIMNAISNLYLDVILVTGLGIVLGIFFGSRLVGFLLEQFQATANAIIIGFVLGSLAILFPGWPSTSGLIVMSVITFIAGVGGAYILGKIEYKE